MLRAIATALMLTAIPTVFAGQSKPRTVHIEGDRAKRLVSLLATGSETIAASLRDAKGTRIVLHDLMVLKFATYKYDGDSGMYNLDVYSAEAKIGDAAQSAQLGEATALFELLSTLGSNLSFQCREQTWMRIRSNVESTRMWRSGSRSASSAISRCPSSCRRNSLE
jgi:hypothetical protein